MSTLETTIEQKKKANKIIRFRTLFATGAGLIPFPLVDAAGILTIQLWMLKDLAKVYGVPFKKHLAKSLILTLVGDLGTVGMVKLIPGIGTLPGIAATAVSGAAATYALGKLFHQHFSQGGTLLSFDPLKSQAYFRQLYEQGKAELQAQQAGMQNVQAQALASTDALKKANDELRATIAVLQTQLKQEGGTKPAVAILQNLKKGKRSRWLVPLLLLLLLGGTYGAYRAGLFRPKKVAEMAAEVTDAATKAGKAAAQTAKELSDAAAAAVADTTSSNPADSTAAAQTPLRGQGVSGQADSTAQKKEAQPPTPPDAAALGFAAGTTEAQMADYLSKPKPKFPKTFPLSAVQFEEGATELSPEGKQQVANVAKLLQSYPEVKVKLYSQTDQNGGLAVNRQAGVNRAKSIENVLKQAGVPARRMETAYREKQAEPQGKRGAEIELMKQ